ncbi:glycosyltransferase [Stieleria varia]|uniref:glycosyltransferase n=1 Tax=Stieleria varia TaxID=2528005 RepID=UPI0018D26DB9|nr:glycosyltransferase [Stieleria varia]
MKIHLMTGLLQGGAASGARQLTHALRQQNVDAQLYFPAKLGDEADSSDPKALVADPNAMVATRWSMPLPTRWAAAIRFRLHRQSFKRAMRRRPAGFEIFSSPQGAPRTPWPPANAKLTGEDIIHLHWVTKLIDYESFFASIPPAMPIVWTLHDMNPLTGGCHFSAGCRRFTEGCGQCPQLAESDRGPQDWSRQYFEIKLGLLKRLNLHVVAPSRWLIGQAAESPIFRQAKSFHRIPYGLSDEVHAAATDRAAAREQLGIDPDAFVFCFGAADLDNQRKGARFLIAALQKLSQQGWPQSAGRKVQGLVFGGGQFPDSNIPIRSLGYLQGTAARMQVYNASDVFIVPSTEDNLPLTAMEAMAGGTAMLGFDVSGIPDLVIDGQTGRLAKLADADDLAEKLAAMASDREATGSQGENAKRIAADQYTAQREADAYRSLYAALLADDDSVCDLPTAIDAARL